MCSIKSKLETVIFAWVTCNEKQLVAPDHSLAVALLRLDDVLLEHATGKPLEAALRDGFNDSLLTALLKVRVV